MDITEVIEEELVPCLVKGSIEKDCCIFRVPPHLWETNPRAYRPSIVSIGPYHNKNERRLQMIEQLKPGFVELFLETANSNGIPMTMDSLENVVGELEERIRDSYSEHLQLSSEELVRMMILDGCFVLMLITVMSKHVKLTNPNHTIFTLPWIIPTFMIDLLLLENQVPYFLLEELFAKLGLDDHVFLKRIVGLFFEYSLGTMSERVWGNTDKIVPRHLLHLIRETLILESSYKTQGERPTRSEGKPEFILSATKLRLQGIKFKAKRHADTALDIEIEGSTLLIPSVILDKFLETLLLNSVAFEQSCKICEDDVTSYMVFMGFLMKDNEDTSFMRNEKMVENYFGTNEEASHFFKAAGKGVVYDLAESYLAGVYATINSYTSRRSTGCWADLKRSYIGSSVLVLSTIAAVLFFLLAVGQLGIGGASYHNDLKEKDVGNGTKCIFPPPPF